MTTYQTKISYIFALLAALFLSGCAQQPKPMYQWGSYENQIYAIYNNPGKIPVDTQLQNLEKDLESINASKAVPPPGFHAHMGYLYFQTGKNGQALQSFETEKKLFPESATYMDRLIAQLKH